MATRNVSLTGMLDDYVEDRVRSGAFQNASEVVRDALRLHKARTDEESLKEERFRRLLQEGADDIEAGRFVDIEWEELDGWLDGLGATEGQVTRLRLSVSAQGDLDIIFFDSEERFGATVAGRYRRLVSAALRDLREDPERLGVRFLANGVRIYHLRHSRRRLPRRQSVARPRHVLAFRIDEGQIVVMRVLHDAMDLPGRLAEL